MKKGDESPEVEVKVTTIPPEKMYDGQGPYSGFLMIQCEGCMAVHSFFTKRKLFGYRCDKCGTETPLEELLPVHMECRCGKQIKYRTNLREPFVFGNCVRCKNQVPLRLNRRETAYVTMGTVRKG